MELYHTLSMFCMSSANSKFDQLSSYKISDFGEKFVVTIFRWTFFNHPFHTLYQKIPFSFHQILLQYNCAYQTLTQRNLS
jgi:hypothetical protein